jgi:diaminohydroxyphosphoribosylaminopyrimidine deaminase/5-amino-6-(5-phosphoribosylamino)uracil reductase
VLLAPDGQVIGQGWHRGAGTPHAEVAALNQAQAANLPTTGATAVVTLEPCHHWGLTPPCTQALTAAGIKRVVYALADPNPTAAGGAVALAEAGIEVIGPVAERRAIDLNWAWFHALSWGRPVVTWKLATTLDGRIAALDGSSQWITSAAARRHAHANRQEVDAIAIGTGTLYADDPALTARVDATVEAALAPDQPLRVVLGDRPIPAQARLHGPGGPVIALPGHDPAQVLAALAERQVRHLLIEGGATVAAAFLAADLVDAIDAYIAPIILGDGTSAVAPFGVTTLADAPRWQIVETAQLGSDIFTRLRRTTAPEQSFTPTLGGSS